ncbi:MAG: hypothetical protein K2X27_00680 [Candidatus Obscuribacterales bacterium]|nr:hypothetical protein [Candidatus Obscuribacterales bacterium]
MTNGIPITAEIVKLAQLRSRATGCDLRQETARQIAQEAIMELDPELDLLVDEEAAFSRDDRLLSTFDLNDIVINGSRFDIRVVEDGRVSIPRYLLSTSYMNLGTLAVAFHGDRSASVVGYVPKSDWELQDKHAASKDDKVIFRVGSAHFDLSSRLQELLSSANHESRARRAHPVHQSEINQFCGHRQEMTLSKQREFVEAVLANESSWADLQSGLSRSFVKKTLTHASVWNHRLDSMAQSLQSKFNKLSKDDIKVTLAKVAEDFGGQFDSPRYRKEMLLRLTREELSRSLKGEQLAKAARLVEQVLSGRPLIDAVKDSIKSPMAIDLALNIKRQRQKLTNFIEASSDEISLAFRQLALQPVYATHSQTEGEGVESVNEALSLLDAGELAESLKSLEQEPAV